VADAGRGLEDGPRVLWRYGQYNCSQTVAWFEDVMARQLGATGGSSSMGAHALESFAEARRPALLHRVC
jgi:hypothetical protein